METMTQESNRIEGWKPVQKIALADAVYCADCDAITEAKNDHCLGCGLHSIIHVDSLMRGNRNTNQEG